MGNVTLFLFFTICIAGGWAAYCVIAIQLKRLIGYSRYLKFTSILLFWTLITLTILGYVVLTIHVFSDDSSDSSRPSERTEQFVF